MKHSQEVSLWLLAAALPAGAGFVYAHLVHADAWFLQLIAASLWRAAERQASAALGNDPGLACLGLLLIGLLVEVLGPLRKQERATEGRPGNGHE